jgi:hypothetical protein
VGPTTRRIALFVLALAAALSVAELTSDGFRKFTQHYPLITTFLTEALLLVGVYLVIDEIIQRRETRRWSDVTSLGVRALSTRANAPVKAVRDAVGEFGVETERSPTLSDGDYEELAHWLRADDERARSFARAMRQGASGLEEAIIRWGPTLVEDPDSAALINLLPDIVDAARSAARAIATATESVQQFGDDLLVVLNNAAEFDARAPKET